LITVVAVQQGRPAGGEIRLAVMVGELIYANVRLRLTANRTYELCRLNYLKIKFSNKDIRDEILSMDILTS